MRIGEQLQRQRQQHHLSQRDLAEQLHISRQSISKWENGTSLPTFANIVAISDLFGLSLDDLIRGDAVLMNDLKKEYRTSPIADMVIIGYAIAIVSFIILEVIGVSQKDAENWLEVPLWISFIGLALSVDWREIKRALNRKAVIWGSIWLTFLFVLGFYDVAAGFIEGMRH